MSAERLFPASVELHVDKEQILSAHNDYSDSMSHKQYALSGRVGAIISSYFVAVLHLQ